MQTDEHKESYIQFIVFICLSVHTYVCLSVHLSACLSVCLSVCLLLYIRKKGKGKREDGQDALEPEIPLMKKWLVVLCYVLNDVKLLLLLT